MKCCLSIGLCLLLSGFCYANCQKIPKSAGKVWLRQFCLCEGITRVPTKQRVVALTFDDGPFEPYTSQLLQLLKEKEVSATFFMLGKQAEENPKLVQQVVALGHEIGTHSYAHANFSHLKPWQICTRLLVKQFNYFVRLTGFVVG